MKQKHEKTRFLFQLANLLCVPPILDGAECGAIAASVLEHLSGVPSELVWAANAKNKCKQTMVGAQKAKSAVELESRGELLDEAIERGAPHAILVRGEAAEDRAKTREPWRLIDQLRATMFFHHHR